MEFITFEGPKPTLDQPLCWGILNILNNLQPGKKVDLGKASESDLGEAKAALDTAALHLLLNELSYDERCLQVHLQKLNNYKIRMVHQRDAWAKKKLDQAKTVIDRWWQSKAWCLTNCFKDCSNKCLLKKIKIDTENINFSLIIPWAGLSGP